MKNIVKTLLIIIALFSVIGIVFIGVYYIKKNLSLFAKLFSEFDASIEDGELSKKEINDLSDDSVRIVKRISDDIQVDWTGKKDEVENFVKDSAKKLGVITESLKDSIEKVEEAFVPTKPVRSKKVVTKPISTALNARQKDILNYIKNNSQAKMSTVSKIFSEVTPRTLRRDLGKLEQMGFLRQEGKTRDAVYKIV